MTLFISTGIDLKDRDTGEGRLGKIWSNQKGFVNIVK